jgi:glycerol-3-phosphate O-acyltransferase / dihydroxyacetone phosphate acyltransferase
LPLKAGVVIMAIGAMAANPGLKVRIVPVGLSYFHPHRFRSRAVVEFGAPMDVPEEMVQLFSQGGDGKRKAVGQMMDIVFDGLKSVTVRAPDYETLMFIQAGRRLYVPPGQHTSLGQVVELNRKFILGYMRFKDEPRVQKVKDDVIKYNTKLRYAGLKDHQVERATRAGWKSLGLLAYRTGLLALWGGLALPGVILNSPIFILAKIISIRKAKEALAASQVKLKGRDVLATWKVLVSLVVAPILYTFYAGVATYLAHRYKLPVKHQLFMPLYAMAAQPAIAYSTLKFGEVGFDIYKSLPPLFISLLPGNHKVIQDLQRTRAQLSSEIHTIIEDFAPKIWDDFEQKRMLQPSAAKPPTRDNSGVGVSSTEESVLAHPLAWLDERLFGWNSTSRRGSAEGSRRKAPLSESSAEKPDITEEERRLRQQYDAVLSANKDTARDETRSGSTTEEDDDDDDSSYESDDGDYETVFGMIKNGMAVAQGRSSSRRSSRSRQRSHSRSISGESFADKRNRSQSDLRALAMSPSEQRPNPLSSRDDAGRSTAVPESEGNATSRRARTHSLQENISATDLKSVADGETSRQLPFKGASTILETQAAGHDGKPSLGGKRRPPLEDIDSAAETPTGAGSPKRQ